MKRPACALVVALATISIAPLAHAQDMPSGDAASDARLQYQQGTQAFQQKRYQEAALHFEAAAAARTSAVALYTAGLAWDLASRPERAADAYGRALDVGGLDPKQGGLARDRVAQLERTLGTLAVTSPENWRVQLDTFTEVAAPSRLHGSPGVHTVSIRAPGKAIERRDVTLDAGKLVSLELKEEPKVVPKEPEPVKVVPLPVTLPPRLHPFWITRRVVGVGVAAFGVATLGSAVLLGVSANDAKSAYDVDHTRESFDHASALETWTNVAFVSSAVLIVGGAALVLWPEPENAGSTHVSITPSGAKLTGSF